jgi:regulatory protein
VSRLRSDVPIPGRSLDAEACRESALRLLERTRRPRADLDRRLRQAGFAESTVGSVMERLSAVGLVDDVEYARAFLAGRWGRRAAGWRKLEADLRRRGISAEDAGTARARLETETGAINEVESARRVLSQVARRYAKLDPRVRRQRLYALLIRRGFEGDTIEQALAAPDPALAASDDAAADPDPRES